MNYLILQNKSIMPLYGTTVLAVYFNKVSINHVKPSPLTSVIIERLSFLNSSQLAPLIMTSAGKPDILNSLLIIV